MTGAVERARQRKDHRRLRKLLVKDEAQNINGWFVYSLSRDGVGEVLPMAAKPHAARQVVEHLLEDAAQQGVVALSGRLEPAFAPELSENHCLLHRRERWTLIHSKNPELLYAIQRGDAFLTRLEGEWCLRFP